MNEYEALFIIDTEKEKSLKEVLDAILNDITKNKGTINKEETWGKQRLAYPIKRKKEGIYYKLNFSIVPSSIVGLNNNYKLNQDILRVMIIKR